jgi:histidine triad (HIT) family protein
VTDCLFCKIARKELDSEIVVETDDVLAFRDINPGAPTHILVIPKQHIAGSAQELTSDHAGVLGEIFVVISDLASRENLSGGHRIVTNVGADAGQSVHHLHFHLLGGRAMAWPPG